ncbi:hypothetical protein SARC_16503, partial [Sphaeroforma arctica JP610]
YKLFAAKRKRQESKDAEWNALVNSVVDFPAPKESDVPTPVERQKVVNEYLRLVKSISNTEVLPAAELRDLAFKVHQVLLRSGDAMGQLSDKAVEKTVALEIKVSV